MANSKSNKKSTNTPPTLPPSEDAAPDSNYAKKGFNVTYTAILAEHYFEEWKAFHDKVNPDRGDTRGILAIAEWKNEKATEILDLIEKGVAPWDKCPKLIPNKQLEDTKQYVRWFTNQQFNKLAKQTDGLTRADAQKALSKLLRFSSVANARKLFEERKKNEIIAEANKLTQLEQAARYAVAESQMWKDEDHDEWQKEAEARYNVDENQRELPTLLKLFTQALAASGHVGPVQALMLLSTHDSNGHVTTGMVEAGSSDTKFVKTWKAGQTIKACEEEAEQVFQAPFDKWAKSVLPFQESAESNDGAGEFDASVFVKDSNDHRLFPAIDTQKTLPGDIGYYVQRYLEIVYEEQHQAEMLWPEILKCPDKFFDTSLLTFRLFNPRDRTIKTSRIIAFAEELHDLPSPFHFHATLSCNDKSPIPNPNTSSGSGQNSTAASSACKTLTEVGSVDQGLLDGKGRLGNVEDKEQVAGVGNPLTPTPTTGGPADELATSLFNEETERQPVPDDVNTDMVKSSQVQKHAKSVKKGRATKKGNPAKVPEGGRTDQANDEEGPRNEDQGDLHKTTAKKRKRAVGDGPVGMAESSATMKKQKRDSEATTAVAVGEGTLPPQIAGKRGKTGKFWDNVVKAANKKGSLEMEPEVLQLLSRSGRIRKP
ncbi:hypothetical protein AAF712_004667 [Marasmius tenuissimus]|uniref:Uncharacterized protein n=1 Tax=Marasmius tenuissimus TaxID=585030 RepID=A0ABR3A2U0_9AGAR